METSVSSRPSIIRDPNELLILQNHLSILVEDLMDVSLVPGWGDNDLAGALSELDSEILANAKRVVARLYLNAKFPSVRSERSYVNFDPEGEYNNG